jgi:bacteriocin-like protein
MRDQSNEVMRELSDEEMRQVSGGLNALGDTAQLLGGQFVGAALHEDVTVFGGQIAGQYIATKLAQTTV